MFIKLFVFHIMKKNMLLHKFCMIMDINYEFKS